MADNAAVKPNEGGGSVQKSEPATAKNVSASPSKADVGSKPAGETATIHSTQPSAQGSQRAQMSERDPGDNKSVLTLNQDDNKSVISARQSAERRSNYSTNKKEWKGKDGGMNMTIKEEEGGVTPRPSNVRGQSIHISQEKPKVKQAPEPKQAVVSPRGKAYNSKPQDGDTEGKVGTPRVPTEKNHKILKDREANAQWQSEWENKEMTKPYDRYRWQNRSIDSRESDERWQRMLADRAQGDTQMYKANTVDSSSTGKTKTVRSISKDGVFYPGQLPTSKLGESKQKDITPRTYGDFHSGTPRKSVRELKQLDVSAQKYGDFYPHRRSTGGSDFLTQLDEESQLRGQQNKSAQSSAKIQNSSRKGSSNQAKNPNEEPYWLVMDLESNRGYKVKKATTPQSAVRNVRNSPGIYSSRGSIADDPRQTHVFPERFSSNKNRGFNGNDDAQSVGGLSSRSLDSGIAKKPRAPWESPAVSYNAGQSKKNPDDIFRNDKSVQKNTRTNSVDSKAPWEASELEKKGFTPRKDHDDLFRRDGYYKGANNTGNNKQSHAPWETPVNGRRLNDFDVMFGKPAYNGKNHMNGMIKSNSIDNGYRSSWDTLPTKNVSKAEEYHKMLHRSYDQHRGQGY